MSIPNRNSLPNSGFGIASFVIGIIIVGIGIATFLLLSKIRRETMSQPPSLEGESLIYSALGYYALGIPVSILGVIFGIIGLVQKQKRKLFSVLGIALNVLPGLSIVVLILTITFLIK